MDEEANKEIKQEIINAQPAQFPDFSKINERLRDEAKHNVNHSPIQQGPYLICRSCTQQHTIAWIGTEKMLVGVKENGEPILKAR